MFLALLFIFGLLNVNTIEVTAVETPPPTIAVIPQSTVDQTLTPGKNYTVSIYTDYSGNDVTGYQFSLSYNPHVLKGVKVTNGDLITTDKHPDAMFLPGEFDNTAGELSLTGAFFKFTEEPAPVTNGPGILANVIFTVVGTGDSNITLVKKETMLIGYDPATGKAYNIVDDITPDIGHILDGYFRNTGEVIIHDVAVISVTPSPTTVKQGELVNITVVVENQGTVTESFTVTVYYNRTHPDWRVATPKTVHNLEAGANKSLTFVWNTTDVSVANHAIWAEASTVPGETDTTDNTLKSEDTVTVEKAPPKGRMPIETTIAIVVVAVIVVAVVAYAVKRRKKSTSE